MPISFRPYAPPPLSNLRERLLKSKLDQVDAYEAKFATALQEASDRGLSPVLLRINQQELASIRGLRSNLRNGLETIKQQGAAERKAEQSTLREVRDPLARSRLRRGFYRTEQDRNAAIEGILERERRRTAPLTREAWSRAKAIAASRRLYDFQYSQLRGSRGYGYIPASGDFADPCADYLRSSKVRKEVLFAKGLAGIGHRSPHHKRKPDWC